MPGLMLAIGVVGYFAAGIVTHLWYDHAALHQAVFVLNANLQSGHLMDPTRPMAPTTTTTQP